MTYSYKSVFIVLMSTVLLFASCGKDDDVVPETPTTSTEPDPSETDQTETDLTEPTSMTAKVDGEDWAASANFEPLAIIYNDYITIGAMSSSNYEIGITLNGTAAGNYSLDPEMGSQLYYRRSGESTYDSKLNNENSNFGFFDIAEMDNNNQTISGTFETEAHYYFNQFSSGSKSISEGQFTNVPFEDRRNPAAEYLSTKIDGRSLHTIYTSAYLSQGSLIVSGEDGSQSESIQLTLPPEIAVGTYDLGGASATTINAQYNPLFSFVLQSATNGTLSITSHDTATKMIEGTVDFEIPNADGDGTINITDGKFRVSYD